ncbi:hypothetical protein BH10ACT1_BH10ACT1_36440 [soil metagenome]
MDLHRSRPPRHRRLLVLAVAIGLVAPLVACGARSSTGGGGDPEPVGAAGDLPAGQVVWVETGGGGSEPPSPVSPHLASLTIYGDGRAFRTVDSDRDSYLDPLPVELGTVADDDLADLVRATEASDLFASDDTDFGDPEVYDADTKVVRFHGSGDRAVEVSAYAFYEHADDDLTPVERGRRQALRDLLDQARTAASDFEPWQPDRLAVAELDDGYRSSGGVARTWTGPAFDTVLQPTEQYGATGCGELTGADATTTWAAALAEPGTSWVDGEDQRNLVVAALLPGQQPCTTATSRTTSPTTTTAPRTTTTEGDGAPFAPPAGQVVWQERTGGGFVPAEVTSAEVPDVTIYGDGRVMVAPDGEAQRPGAPVALQIGTVPAHDLEAFVADVASSGLFSADGDVDFGTPGATDGPTTSVTFRGTGPDQLTASAYFLSDDVESGLSDAQVDRRHALSAFVQRARSLARDLTAWTPDRVQVVELDAGGVPAAGEPMPWPGPSIDKLLVAGETDGVELGCGAVTGPAAAEVFEAARANATNRWLVDGKERTLVITSLVPGQPSC